MTIHQTSSWRDIPPLTSEVPRERRRRAQNVARFIFFGILGTLVAIGGPTLLALLGIGMSAQPVDVAANAALASLLAIILSFVAIRRLLSLPLLRAYGYVALTFVSSFASVAIGLKFFRIEFSSPQFFFGMVTITALVELFLYARRHETAQNIVVVPGAETLINLPRRTLGSVKLTSLTAVPSDHRDCDGIIANFCADLEPEWERFLAMAALEGIPVYDVKQFNEARSGRVVVDHLRENTFGGLVPALIYPQFKRAFDLSAALLLLPLVAPIIGICGIFIKRETPGPIFFQQQRIGLGGRPFTILKLRTMKHNHNGDAYTQPGDDRITRIGRFLRQYRLDELPQVINILRGEMSWIGPRPEAVSLAEWYEQEVPFYVYRHIVRPGLSGWAQVHQGNVAAPDAARLKLEYDFFYIKHFSFSLDAVIFLKTLRTILTGFGSR